MRPLFCLLQILPVVAVLFGSLSPPVSWQERLPLSRPPSFAYYVLIGQDPDVDPPSSGNSLLKNTTSQIREPILILIAWAFRIENPSPRRISGPRVSPDRLSLRQLHSPSASMHLFHLCPLHNLQGVFVFPLVPTALKLETPLFAASLTPLFQ